MTTDQRRSWLVATALFLMLVLSYSSAYLTMGIFFTPLIKNFGYSHARVSAHFQPWLFWRPHCSPGPQGGFWSGSIPAS